uniref:Uncharacterized protein n=1 Tax=Clastoptera arizonana TaxID=38151 RepID=A0A1B6CMS7_9HEMI
MLLNLILFYIFTGTCLALELHISPDKEDKIQEELIDFKTTISKSNSLYDRFCNDDILDFIRFLGSWLELTLNEIRPIFKDEYSRKEPLENSYNDDSYEDDLNKTRSRRYIEQYSDIVDNDIPKDPIERKDSNFFSNGKFNKTDYDNNLDTWFDNLIPRVFNSSQTSTASEKVKKFVEKIQNATLSTTEKSLLRVTLKFANLVKKNLSSTSKNIVDINKTSSTILSTTTKNLLQAIEERVLKDKISVLDETSTEKIRKRLLKDHMAMYTLPSYYDLFINENFKDKHNNLFQANSEQRLFQTSPKEEMVKEDAGEYQSQQLDEEIVRMYDLVVITTVVVAIVLIGEISIYILKRRRVNRLPVIVTPETMEPV